jgi:hypothetical protein
MFLAHTQVAQLLERGVRLVPACVIGEARRLVDRFVAELLRADEAICSQRERRQSSAA